MKVRATLCTYAGKWIRLGRARTRCPDCGAELKPAGNATHPVELRDIKETVDVRNP